MADLTGRLPDAVIACVGGGSNAIGTFHPFIEDKSVRIVGVEAAGEGESLSLASSCLFKRTDKVASAPLRYRYRFPLCDNLERN